MEIRRDGANATQYTEAVARQRQVAEWMEKRGDWITLVSIPITALAFWLFYRRLHYAEHLVAQIVLAGFYMLTGTLLTLLAFVPALHSFATFQGQLFLQGGYLTWAYGRFMGGATATPAHFLRAALATVCALLLWILFSVTLIFLYFAFG